MASTDDQTFRDKVADLFGIGSGARDDFTILANIRNALHRVRCLDAVERELFTKQVPDEDEPDEMTEKCSVNSWGSTPENYVEQMRAAIAASR